MLLIHSRNRLYFFYLCYSLLTLTNWSSSCYGEVPPHLVEEFVNSRNKIKSLSLKIQYETESPLELLDFAKLTNMISFKKGTEIVAFDSKYQVHRFKYDEKPVATQDEQGNWKLITIPELEEVTATKEGLNKNITLPGNMGMLYSKNYYPYEYLFTRSYYMTANSFYVEDPLASQDAKNRIKKTTLPDAFALVDFQLENQDDNEFVFSRIKEATDKRKAGKQVITVSKKVGYRVKSIEYYWLPEMQPISAYRCSDFRLVSDDVWLPYQAEYIQYHEGEFVCRTLMKVLEVELNKGISKRAEFEFAPGTQVKDFSGVTPKQAAEIKRTRRITSVPTFTIAADGAIIDQQLKVLPKSNRNFLWIIIAVNVVLALGLITYFLFQKRAK